MSTSGRQALSWTRSCFLPLRSVAQLSRLPTGLLGCSFLGGLEWLLLGDVRAWGESLYMKAKESGGSLVLRVCLVRLLWVLLMRSFASTLHYCFE